MLVFNSRRHPLNGYNLGALLLVFKGERISLKNEQQTRATLFAEIQQEQSRKDAKGLNLVVKGTKPSENCTGYDIVEKIANQIDVSLVSSDVQCKWIGKPQRDTGNQLLLLKFKEMIKRNQFLRKSVALRDCVTRLN